MRRMTLPLASLLLFGVSQASDSPKDYDNATMEGIEGTWRLTETECYGEKRDAGYQCILIIRSETWTCDWTGSQSQYRYRIDPACTPAHLDRTPLDGPFQGQTLKGIFQIDGDTLKTAIMGGRDDMRRPKGFHDENLLVWSYKRVR
jgi:uncharacterized protein (TIGR03067 family)